MFYGLLKVHNLTFYRVDLPGSGSDHAPFRDQLGVPIVDMWFTYDPVS